MVGLISTPQYSLLYFGYKTRKAEIGFKTREQVCSNIEERKKCLLEVIQSLDYLEEEHSLEVEENVRRAKAKKIWRRSLFCKKSVRGRNLGQLG